MFIWDKKTVILAVGAFCLLLLGGWWRFGAGDGLGEEVPRVVAAETYREADKGPEEFIQVHVAGAVRHPGVVRLAPGSRVVDAVYLAVAAEGADLDGLNLAQTLKDGQKVMVPRKGEVGGAGANGRGVVAGGGTGGKGLGAGAGAASGAAEDGIVDINQAGLAELDRLPGIGPAMAQRIIDYREANGPFVSVEDLKKVPGIGEKKFADLVDKIRV